MTENGVEKDVLVVRKHVKGKILWSITTDGPRAVIDTGIAGTLYLLYATSFVFSNNTKIIPCSHFLKATDIADIEITTSKNALTLTSPPRASLVPSSKNLMSLLFARLSWFDVVSMFETENLVVCWRSRIRIFCLSMLVRCDSSLDGRKKGKKGPRVAYEFR